MSQQRELLVKGPERHGSLLMLMEWHSPTRNEPVRAAQDRLAWLRSECEAKLLWMASKTLALSGTMEEGVAC